MLVKVISINIGFLVPLVFLSTAIIRKTNLRPLLLGAACFTVSQVLLRIPLLQLLSKNSDFLLFEGTQPLLYGLLLALSAGLFEETGRLIFMKLGLSKQNSWSTGLWFGLGHGGIEAVLFYGLPVLMIPASQAGVSLLIGGVERIFAMLLHVGLSLLVLYGVQRKQKRFYLTAVLLHTLVDALVTIIPLYTQNSLLLIEGALILTSVGLFLYTLNLRRKWEL